MQSLGKPRSKLRDFDPIPSETRNWSNEEMQGREVHAKDSLKGNIMSEKAAKKTHNAGRCELHKTKIKQLIADTYMIFQEIQRVVQVYTRSQIIGNDNSR